MGLVGLSCRSETSVHSAPAAIDLKDYSATSDAVCSLSFGLCFTEAPINLSSVTLTFVSKSVTGQTWAIHIRLYIVFFSLHFLWRAHYAVTAEANSSPLHVSMCLSVNVFWDEVPWLHRRGGLLILNEGASCFLFQSGLAPQLAGLWKTECLSAWISSAQKMLPCCK